MFGAQHNSVNFDRFIEERKVVVVKGGFDSLGEEGMRVFLQFLVAQYYAAGMRRLRIPEHRRHLCLMLVDEASHVMTSPIIARALVDLRKTSCAFVAATQVWDQIGTEVRSAVLGATATKICGPIQHNDAMVLSREMYCTPEFIRDMDSYPGRGAEWAINITPEKKSYRVRSPYGVLEAMPRINPSGISMEQIETIVDKLLAERAEQEDQDYFDQCYEEAMQDQNPFSEFLEGGPEEEKPKPQKSTDDEATIKPGRNWENTQK
jgi:hypothetical protein